MRGLARAPWVAATRGVSLAVGSVLALSACGGTEIGTVNNCTTGAHCAGRDHNETVQDKTAQSPGTSPPPSAAASAAPATYSLVYQNKPLGLAEPDCIGSWYADFEERTSKFYSDEEISDMKRQATDSGQQMPLDFYYGNCAWGAFGSDHPWGVVASEPANPEDCEDAAKSGGMDYVNLHPRKDTGQVKPGTLICTLTDAGVALLQVKSFERPDSTDSPTRVALDVTLWKKG